MFRGGDMILVGSLDSLILKMALIGAKGNRISLMILQVPRVRPRFKSPLDPLRFVWRLFKLFYALLLLAAIKVLGGSHLKTVITDNINQKTDLRLLLRESQSELAFVKGGRILSAELLSSFRGTWINSHGGVLPRYRGLDSHLWAISSGDFGNVGVTLHELNLEIDVGKILKVTKFKLKLDSTIGEIEKGINALHLESLRWALDARGVSNLQTIGESINSKDSYFSRFPGRVRPWHTVESLIKNDK
jgi:folate-dependent phosphoribosylglycinamide formyltransferase PurN